MKVCVVMPAWNESEGVGGFLAELSASLNQHEPAFVVVDDFSSDGTRAVVEETAASGINVTVVTNDRNRGHGPSTMRALALGLASGADVVLALDGDGQFRGMDVARVLGALDSQGIDVVEGVRTNRQDPAYRKVVTTGTRVMVWARTRRLPADANTPLRAYRSPILARILETVSPDSITPNLNISVLCRNWPIGLAEVPVVSQPRRGQSAIGSTWGKGSLVPSKRFIGFCRDAVSEWVGQSSRGKP